MTNDELVAKMYDALMARDVDFIFKHIHADLDLRQAEELPWGGHFVGQEGLIQFFGLLTGTITSQVTTELLFSAGAQVVQVGRTAGTVNETGAPFDVPEVHVWTIREGKVAAVDYFIDTPAMLAALANER